ncbi:hypothetical protein [Brasilonema bromeliae]|uniref:Uncharacterized protein n=1 Tax=Brasilonema bromeliae SPC951 TaxID=385972 RepID=A0ABX1PF63_9CYAN|nr:hypothetical protein [Brasilonema bromeliae]NMG23115.1 hypothetical protein [Brasilonema bromeliae SPC951]
MTLTDFYNAVAKQADTDKTAIGVADTKRVLAVAFSVLHTLPTADVLDVIAKGLATAAKKAK